MSNTKDAQICVRMDSELREKLQEIADREERSLAFIVNRACKEYLDNHKEN